MPSSWTAPQSCPHPPVPSALSSLRDALETCVQTLTAPCPLSSQLVVLASQPLPVGPVTRLPSSAPMASCGSGSDAGKSQDMPQPRGL